MLKKVKHCGMGLVLIGSVGCGTTSVPTSPTGTIRLSWEPPKCEGVLGYRVYYGLQSRTYNHFEEVQGVNSTNYSLTKLPKNWYYISATALYPSGESGFSNEATAQPQ